MEVSENVSNTREVVGVESDRTGFIIGWGRWVILGTEGKPPKLGAGRSVSPSEEDCVIGAIDCDRFFVKHNAAVVVT